MLATQSTNRPDRVFRFGPFELAPHLGELRRNCRRVQLQNQPMLILIALLDRPGQLVTREALQRTLWPADTFVDFDMGLNTAVRKLRQALGDSSERPRYIETHARRGYRFIAPVTCAVCDDALPPDTSLNDAPSAPIPAALIERQTATASPSSDLKGESTQELETLPETAEQPLARPSKPNTIRLLKAHRLSHLPAFAAKTATALLVLALLLVGLLLASLLTVWSR